MIYPDESFLYIILIIISTLGESITCLNTLILAPPYSLSLSLYLSFALFIFRCLSIKIPITSLAITQFVSYSHETCMQEMLYLFSTKVKMKPHEITIFSHLIRLSAYYFNIRSLRLSSFIHPKRKTNRKEKQNQRNVAVIE